MEQTSLRVVCTSECTLDVPKQLSFDQGGSQCRTINRDEHLPSARSRRVNGSRHQFFSGSRLANDQNRGVALADLSDHLHELTHRGGFTDQTAKASLSGQRRAREVHVVLHSFGFLSWGRQGGKIFAKSVSRYN